jgi:hypothetical protein
MNRHFLTTVAALLLAPAHLLAQQADKLGTAVAEIEQLDAMRSSLASSFLQTGAPADKAAFGAVCKPVGMKMMQGAKDNGWVAQQLSTKYRNPKNAADPEAVHHLRAFERDQALRAVVLRTTRDGIAGTRYLRRIDVEASCLLCHGAKDARPAFVQEEYPEDRAHGFAVGDLRGAYSVFIPDKAAAAPATTPGPR